MVSCLLTTFVWLGEPQRLTKVYEERVITKTMEECEWLKSKVKWHDENTKPAEIVLKEDVKFKDVKKTYPEHTKGDLIKGVNGQPTKLK